MNNNLLGMESYYGQIKNPADAVLLFEGSRTGLAPRVQRRLSEKERQQIRSGSVFVWDEREAGMRRWTDGKSWSASRVSGSFLTYREMEGKRGGAGMPNTGGRKSAGSGKDDTNSDPENPEDGPDGYRYKADGLMKQSFSIATNDGRHLHLISYYSRAQTSNLKTPSTDPLYRNVRPPKGMYPESTINEPTAMGPGGRPTPLYPQPPPVQQPQYSGYWQAGPPPPGYAPYPPPPHGHWVSPMHTPPAGSPPGYPPAGYYAPQPAYGHPPYSPHQPPYAPYPPPSQYYAQRPPPNLTQFDKAPPAPVQSPLPPLRSEGSSSLSAEQDRSPYQPAVTSPTAPSFPQLSGGTSSLDKNRFHIRTEAPRSSSHSRTNSGSRLDKPPTPPASNGVTPDKEMTEPLLPHLHSHVQPTSSLLPLPASLPTNGSSDSNRIPSIQSLMNGTSATATLPPVTTSLPAPAPLAPISAIDHGHRNGSRSPLPPVSHMNGNAGSGPTKDMERTPLAPIRDILQGTTAMHGTGGFIKGRGDLDKLNSQFFKG